MNKKLAAFTIMEVTIAMLLAAITIAITFTAYRIVSGSYLGFSRKQERVAAFTVLDQVLNRDVNGASAIVRTATGLSFKMQQGQIDYSFTDSTVLRDQFSLRTDTFKLVLKEPVFSFEAEPVDEGKLVDQFGFGALVEAELIPLRYQKKYSAQDLFD